MVGILPVITEVCSHLFLFLYQNVDETESPSVSYFVGQGFYPTNLETCGSHTGVTLFQYMNP